MSGFSLPSPPAWRLAPAAGHRRGLCRGRCAEPRRRDRLHTLFSLAPILLLAIAIAGLAFGRDAARGAIVEQLSGLMGGKSAEALQAMIESASDPKTGMTASLIGILEQSPR
jgi:hypothetical protein